jgi:hypothetical protein
MMKEVNASIYFIYCKNICKWHNVSPSQQFLKVLGISQGGGGKLFQLQKNGLAERKQKHIQQSID